MSEELDGGLRPGSVGAISEEEGKFPYDAFSVDSGEKTDSPILELSSEWMFKNGSIWITSLGGIAVKMVASEALSEGEVVEATMGGTSKQVRKVTAGEDWPLGVVYADAASGAAVWIVVMGLAYVLPESDVTPAIGDHVYVSAGGGTDGRASMQNTINTVRHWGEIGHCVTASAEGVKCLCLIHFN